MSDKKPKKNQVIMATVPVSDPDADYQMCWGVKFDVKEGDNGEKYLETSLPGDEAAAMIEAGRAKAMIDGETYLEASLPVAEAQAMIEAGRAK